MFEVTSKLVTYISVRDLLKMKKMDEMLSTSMNFYSTMATAAHFGKPGDGHIACRMVQYSTQWNQVYVNIQSMGSFNML
jgi:hypothetical protein